MKIRAYKHIIFLKNTRILIPSLPLHLQCYAVWPLQRSGHLPTPHGAGARDHDRPRRPRIQRRRAHLHRNSRTADRDFLRCFQTPCEYRTQMQGLRVFAIHSDNQLSWPCRFKGRH